MSHVWAAGGARAQARRSTGDVVGGLPPKQSRGLRGGPAQKLRTEVGRTRSCCQGWTGLDYSGKNVGKWHRGVERERKHSTAPGDARTFVNPTYSASARLVKLYSNYVCDFVLLCLVVVVSRCFSPCDIP